VILEAAGRRFAERGFAGVSMREIAADAGLRNQASLYHHFKNKRALYVAALVRGIEPIVAMAAAGPASDAPESGLIDPLVEYLAAHPHLPRLIQRVGLEDQRYVPSVVPRVIGPLYAEGVKALARMSPQWSTADLPHLALGFYHLIFGYFASAPLLEAALGSDWTAPAAVRRQQAFVRAVFDLLVRPAAGRPTRTRRRRRS
jgi:AcrR family transcriptional regulator